VHPANRHSRAVAELLDEVGRDILLPAFAAEDNATEMKRDGSVVTETDLQCQAFIRRRLLTLDPDIRFLGEEMAESEQQACLNQGGRFWCVDPLDGTSNFTADFPCFASAVALIEDGQPVLACIHDPVRGETFEAVAGTGARLNGRPMHASHAHALKQAVGFIDFKRLPEALRLALAGGKAYRSQRNIGSCALEWAWLAAGRGQFIIHGGQKLWDFAAGSLLAAEAGAVTTNFAGADPFAGARLVSSIVSGANAPLHAALLAVLETDNA
jgi:myo-inositol-1(or 4)-monophosphatase